MRYSLTLLIMQRCQHGGGAGLVIRALLCGADSTALRDSYQTHQQLSVSPTLSLWNMLSVVTTTIDNPVFLSVCLSDCLCVYHLLSVCLSIYSLVCACVCVCLCLSFHLSIYLSLLAFMSIQLYVCLFIQLSYLSVHPSIHPSFHPWDIFFCLSIYPSIQLSIYPSIQLPILSVCHPSIRSFMDRIGSIYRTVCLSVSLYDYSPFNCSYLLWFC